MRGSGRQRMGEICIASRATNGERCGRCERCDAHACMGEMRGMSACGRGGRRRGRGRRGGWGGGNFGRSERNSQDSSPSPPVPAPDGAAMAPTSARGLQSISQAVKKRNHGTKPSSTPDLDLRSNEKKKAAGQGGGRGTAGKRASPSRRPRGEGRLDELALLPAQTSPPVPPLRPLARTYGSRCGAVRLTSTRPDRSEPVPSRRRDATLRRSA